MKLYVRVIGLVVGTVLSTTAVAGDVYNYQYGQKLDIAKVIKLVAPDLDHCGLVDASLTYQDSKGAVHTMVYHRLADICNRQG